MMVRDFQSIVGGGSNAMGMFTAFLHDPHVKLVGVEPLAKAPTNRAATRHP